MSRARGSRAAFVVTLAALAVLCASSSALAASPGWRVFGATGPTNLPPVTDEVQTLAIDAGAGTFTLTVETPGHGASTTSPLPFDLGSAQLEAALNALPAVADGGGRAVVKGGPGNPGAELPYFIRFEGALTGQDLPPMSADASGLGGGTVTVNTTTQGEPLGHGGLVVYPTNVGASPTSGEITVTVGPLPTGITGGSSSLAGWSCSGGPSVLCSRSAGLPGIAAGATTVPINIPLVIDGAIAAPESSIPIAITGGGASRGSSYVARAVVSDVPAQPGVQAFWAGAFDQNANPETQAGAHPYSAFTGLLLNTVLAADGTRVLPAGDLREARAELPPGFIANPLATPRCPQNALAYGGLEPQPPPGSGFCNPNMLVGSFYALLRGFGNKKEEEEQPEAGENPAVIYLSSFLLNDLPPVGSPAEFSAVSGPVLFRLLGALRSDGDFGVSAVAPSVPTLEKVFGSVVGFQGFPAGANGKPFLANPTNCAETALRAPIVGISTSTWQQSSVFSSATEPQPAVTGCDKLRFAPSFSFQPTATQAATGVGATAHIHIDQSGITDPNSLVAPHLKQSVVALPAGLSLNPSAANGLQACSEAQIGFKGGGYPMPNPLRFDEAAPSCPDGSKLGTVSVKTPLLEDELQGTIYLATQDENPFHSLIALYLVVDDAKTGIVLKLPGKVEADPRTGQLTASFDNNPQLPFEDLTLSFRGGGPRSQLATPDVCGTYTTHGDWTPWSAPESGPPAQTEDRFAISGGPGGGTCASSPSARPFSPSFDAGTTGTHAGSYNPLVIRVTRRDGEQELTRLEFTLPPGLTGRLAGIPYCSEAAIAAAKGRTGKAEQASSSCPAASELGTVDTAAGVGSEPIRVGGHVYLAGPYEGAPLSSVVITPAVAGPFDLGNVVVRAPLYVNPETAQITAKSDEIPHILKGIPLQVRLVEIKVSRQGFILNPTSCDAMAIGSSMSGLSGATAKPSSRFQVGGCSALKFQPQLKLSVLGKTNRNAKPRLKAVLTAKPGEANIARAQVNLPHSEFLEQNHIKTICTRVQFAAGDGNGSACPKGSIYGRAKAWTPLLAHPLEGPVYLRSSSNELPDLVAALNGQVNIALAGKVDSGPNEGIRNTFEVVPDAPVSRFVLEMNGGKKGLLVNSENLCSRQAKRKAIVRLVGQNGKVRAFKPTVANRCDKQKGRRKHHRKRGAKETRHQGRAAAGRPSLQWLLAW